MQALEGKKLIQDIEQKYDVMSVKWKGVSVWPFIRIYLKESVTTMRENKASASVVGLVLRCLFAFNPLRALKKHDVWTFTGCDRRKRLGDKMVHRISGAFASEGVNSLMIEKPLIGAGHYSRKEIEEKDIISESWLLMTFHIMEVLSRFVTPKLENEDLLKQILRENSLQFNYFRYVRMLNAQRKAMRLLLKLTPKPKVVFMECPYNIMGYMWAFHEKGIKVIEMQHGSLNGNHLAYCAKDYERKMNPDCICVFGEEEYKYLTKEKPQYSPEVKMTGLYILERADKYFSKDIFEQDRMKYQSVIVIAGQPAFEDSMAQFVDSVASEHNGFLFVYIPRHRRDDLQFKSSNVRLVNGVNIYEYLKWADVHITITSTTCLEAYYFRTPTIFYNFENLSATYFKEVLCEVDGFSFIDLPQQFDAAYQQIQCCDFSKKEFFAHDHVNRFLNVINENLNNNKKL